MVHLYNVKSTNQLLWLLASTMASKMQLTFYRHPQMAAKPVLQLTRMLVRQIILHLSTWIMRRTQRCRRYVIFLIFSKTQSRLHFNSSFYELQLLPVCLRVIFYIATCFGLACLELVIASVTSSIRFPLYSHQTYCCHQGAKQLPLTMFEIAVSSEQQVYIIINMTLILTWLVAYFSL